MASAPAVRRSGFCKVFSVNSRATHTVLAGNAERRHNVMIVWCKLGVAPVLGSRQGSRQHGSPPPTPRSPPAHRTPSSHGNGRASGPSVPDPPSATSRVRYCELPPGPVLAAARRSSPIGPPSGRCGSKPTRIYNLVGWHHCARDGRRAEVEPTGTDASPVRGC